MYTFRFADCNLYKACILKETLENVITNTHYDTISSACNFGAESLEGKNESFKPTFPPTPIFMD